MMEGSAKYAEETIIWHISMQLLEKKQKVQYAKNLKNNKPTEVNVTKKVKSDPSFRSISFIPSINLTYHDSD
jgi:hypothetical protein